MMVLFACHIKCMNCQQVTNIGLSFVQVGMIFAQCIHCRALLRAEIDDDDVQEYETMAAKVRANLAEQELPQWVKELDIRE